MPTRASVTRLSRAGRGLPSGSPHQPAAPPANSRVHPPASSHSARRLEDRRQRANGPTGQASVALSGTPWHPRGRAWRGGPTLPARSGITLRSLRSQASATQSAKGPKGQKANGPTEPRVGLHCAPTHNQTPTHPPVRRLSSTLGAAWQPQASSLGTRGPAGTWETLGLPPDTRPWRGIAHRYLACGGRRLRRPKTCGYSAQGI